MGVSMKKDCFSQEFVDSHKFQECASCHLFDECTKTVYLKEARTATTVGEGLGYAVAVVFLAVAASTWAAMPHGAPWVAFCSLLYGLAVYRAGRDYRERNAEESGQLAREAESKPESGPAPAAHH
jgi:hypothetical protein